MDFPTGLGVENVSQGCPKWNQFNSTLLRYGIEFATSFVADQGWFITCSLAALFPRVYHVAKARGDFILHRTITLIVEAGYVYDDGQTVSIVFIVIFFCMCHFTKC